MNEMNPWGDGEGPRFVEFVVAGLALLTVVELIVLFAHR